MGGAGCAVGGHTTRNIWWTSGSAGEHEEAQQDRWSHLSHHTSGNNRSPGQNKPLLSSVGTGRLNSNKYLLFVVYWLQAVSTGDVRREITFCKKTGVKILGIIENMSGFICPHCLVRKLYYWMQNVHKFLDTHAWGVLINEIVFF